jgi:opacity protein-like surface antigen
MRIRSIFAAAASAALLAAPAYAAKPADPGGQHAGAGASHGQGKAYGRYCAGQSKKHVAGQPGTPFSQCVKAMAKLASGAATSPRAACKGLSKKHVAGQKGTPFSRCIVAAAHLRHDDEQQSNDSSGAAPSPSNGDDTGSDNTSAAPDMGQQPTS